MAERDKIMKELFDLATVQIEKINEYELDMAKLVKELSETKSSLALLEAEFTVGAEGKNAETRRANMIIDANRDPEYTGGLSELYDIEYAIDILKSRIRFHHNMYRLVKSYMECSNE